MGSFSARRTPVRVRSAAQRWIASSPTPAGRLAVSARTPRRGGRRFAGQLNRWYDAITGRWLSRDPIGFAAADANLYRYCGNSAASAVDPTGLRAANWFSNYVYVVGPTIVPSPPGKVSMMISVHYVTSWFTTSVFAAENDHLIGTKVLTVCPQNAMAAAPLVDRLGELSEGRAGGHGVRRRIGKTQEPFDCTRRSSCFALVVGRPAIRTDGQ